MGFLISKLSKEDKEVGKLFEGWLRSLRTCLKCRTPTKVDNRVNIILLELGGNWNSQMLEAAKLLDKKQWTIEELLENFRKKEELKETNQVLCQYCGDLQAAEKNLEVLEGPKILVLQLKRYAINNGKKLEPFRKQKIAYGRLLDLKRNTCGGMLSENETYILRGVIEHIGKSTKEGHYNAYVRTGKEWVEFSDERSSKASWEEVKNKQAYVLIWEKIDRRGKE